MSLAPPFGNGARNINERSTRPSRTPGRPVRPVRPVRLVTSTVLLSAQNNAVLSAQNNGVMFIQDNAVMFIVVAGHSIADWQGRVVRKLSTPRSVGRNRQLSQARGAG